MDLGPHPYLRDRRLRGPGGHRDRPGRGSKEDSMMGWYDGGWGGPWMVLFWVVVIGAVVWGVARLTRRPGDGTVPPPVESPRQILDRRFASGELTEEQYAAARRALEGHSVDREPRG